jgi:phosphoribosylformimino-5-aminoimidazole carboxamide ribotide isomerase
MRIIPAIDIINGQCVRLTKGDYALKKVYNEDPLEIAKQFEAAGIKYLHLVDLDGAKAKHVVNIKILEKIIKETNLIVDFGGGVKSEKDLVAVFDVGANQVTVGSLAAKDPELFLQWLEDFGPEKIILGADANFGKIATDGWKEESTLEVNHFIEGFVNKGVEYVISTDIQKDGMLQGPSFGLYEELLKIENIKLIASGGIRNKSDLNLLKEMGCEGAIVGKAIYEGWIKLEELC